MGTRALTYVYDDNNKDILVAIYRQYDGYHRSWATTS